MSLAHAFAHLLGLEGEPPAEVAEPSTAEGGGAGGGGGEPFAPRGGETPALPTPIVENIFEAAPAPAPESPTELEAFAAPPPPSPPPPPQTPISIISERAQPASLGAPGRPPIAITGERAQPESEARGRGGVVPYSTPISHESYVVVGHAHPRAPDPFAAKAPIRKAHHT